jgi:glycerol uptake facilitator-like aquaporin
MTFLLMVVIKGVSTDTRAVGVMAGAAIGAVVALDAFVGGWATGASMNPARSLAPAIVQGELGSVWIYLLAPVGGAVAGALTYRVIGRQNG